MATQKAFRWFCKDVAGTKMAQRPGQTDRPLGAVVGGGGGSGPTDLPGWTLNLVEDFATINTARWTLLDGAVMSGHLESVKPANITIDTTVAGATNGGAVRQQAKVEAYAGRAYTAGLMYTRSKYLLPNYFRVEARAKTTWEHGMWPAPMWFRPNDLAGAYEIDLIESVGNETDLMHYTLHAGDSYTAGVHQQNGLSEHLPTPSGWHTYVIEKLPNSIKIFRDGTLAKAWTNTTSSPITSALWATAYENAARTWFLWSNLQMGGWNGNVPDGTTNWADPDATAMWLDYVYTWTVAS